MIVRELITRLGFEADESKVKKFDSSVKTLTSSLKVAVTATAAVGGALFALAKSTQSTGDEIAKTARKIGIGTTELQKWRFAAGQAGVDTATLNSSLSAFTRRVGAAAQGGGPAAKTLEGLNIRLRDADGNIRSVSDLLPEVADKFKGLTSEAQKADIAQNLFNVSGRQMALFLEMGSDGIAELTDKFDALGGAMSEDGTANAEAMGDALDDLNVIGKSLVFRIGEQLMPLITDIALSMRDWFIENKRLITQDLKSFVEGLTSGLRIAWAVIGSGLSVINSIVQAMGGWGPVIRLTTIALSLLFAAKIISAIVAFGAAIKAAGGAMLILNKILLANPLGLVLAVLVLLIDEIWNWQQGNETVIALVLGSWEEFSMKLGDMIDGIVSFFVNAWTTITDGLTNAFTSTVDGIRRLFNSLFNFIIERWKAVLAPIQTVRNAIKGAVIPKFLRDRFGGDEGSDPSATVAADVASGVTGSGLNAGTRILNNSADVNITVPPGTTDEQVSRIREEINKSMAQQIRDAALVLEGS